MIEHDLENTPLEIKTDSEVGSEDRVYVFFFDSDDNSAGGLSLYFSSPLKYGISYCMSDYAEFDTTPPSDKDKVWRLTIDRDQSSTLVNLLIHCNNQLVLQRVIASSRCDSYSSTRWSREIDQIAFPDYETGSDAYRPYKPGKCYV